MKFRIKTKNLVKPILVQFETPTVSVLQLKTKVAEIFQLDDSKSTDSLQLSFNGTDAINAEEGDSLVALGFVSGDAIYILGTSPLEQQLPSNQSENLPKLMSEPTQQSSPNQSANLSELVPEPTVDQRDHQLSVTDRFIPPARLSETPDYTVPQSFSALSSANPNEFHSTFEEFCGFLHLLTVETGFMPSISDRTTQLSYCNLPDSWNVQHETLKLNYLSPYPPFSQCTLVVTAIGQIVLVYGIVSSQKSLTLKLKLSDFISNGSYRNLKKLSLLFKNEISYPLLVTIQREINGPCPYNLSNLPPEISYQILVLLDVRSLCRLSQVSRLFQELTSQPFIWKKRVVRDFGSDTGRAIPNDDWKGLYKAEFKMKQKHKRAASVLRQQLPTFPTGPVFPTTPFGRFEPDRPFPPEFPGIIGGDNDLFPDLRGIGPPSRRLPSNRGNNRNHPFFPFPGGNYNF